MDLKRRPELLSSVAEAVPFPELGKFLEIVNSPPSIFETAKCDVWETTDLGAEEQIGGDRYPASHRLACYVDVLFSGIDLPASLEQCFPIYEQFARDLVALLRRAPESPATAEVCVRRCFLAGDSEGLYFTLYVTGYGPDPAGARRNWASGLKYLVHALGELGSSSPL